MASVKKKSREIADQSKKEINNSYPSSDGELFSFMQTFEQLSEQFSEKFAIDHFPSQPVSLYEPNRYFLQLSGKRVRPVLCLMGNELLTTSTRIHGLWPRPLSFFTTSR